MVTFAGGYAQNVEDTVTFTAITVIAGEGSVTRPIIEAGRQIPLQDIYSMK